MLSAVAQQGGGDGGGDGGGAHTAAAASLKKQPSRHIRGRYIHGYRLFWWLGVVLAAGVPASLRGTVGITETWEAFTRYTKGVLGIAQTHPIRVPSVADPVRNYTTTDRDMMAWQESITQLYEHINKMAVVGVVTDSDTGLEFEFDRGEVGEKKGRFYAKRDLSVLLYFALSAAAYFSDSVHLALVVLNLNIYIVAICVRLKGLTDAFGKAVEALEDAQQALLRLPIEQSLLELAQQQACLQKLAALIHSWSSTELGWSLTLPVVHTVTISTSAMASLAVATSVRAIHVIAYGCIPGLPRIRWRETLGLVADVKSKLQSQATELRSEVGQALTALRRPPNESKED